MKIIIIEDEPLVARDLQKLIERLEPDVEIVTILDSLQSSIEYFLRYPEPDLLFMDIQLNDGVSFDIFRKVSLTCPIIFTTAYNDYAIRAFKVNSIDYLLKPIDKTDLKDAIDKFRRMSGEGRADLQVTLDLVVQQIASARHGKIYKERFMAHVGKSFVVIDQSDIAYFVRDELIYIVTFGKQQLITDYQTMDEIEEVVDPKKFFRANRQYVINLKSVDSFRTDANSKLEVRLRQPANITVDVSREKAQQFRRWIQSE